MTLDTVISVTFENQAGAVFGGFHVFKQGRKKTEKGGDVPPQSL